MHPGQAVNDAAVWPRFEDVPLCVVWRDEGAVLSSAAIRRAGWRAFLRTRGPARPAMAQPSAARAAG